LVPRRFRLDRFHRVNNISAIPWQSIIFVNLEETSIPEEGVWIIQVKLRKISDIETLFKVGFIQDAGSFSV
jgi:hypothetical protein